MSSAHRFQIQMARHVTEQKKGPILNAACKEDPAHLGRDFGAINLDIQTFDEVTGRELSGIPQFTRGDVLTASRLFKQGQFALVILGEFLEHCVFAAARAALRELRYVLADDGILVVTLPLDGRPPHRQHSKGKLKVIVPGATGHDITVWHQTVWEDAMLQELFAKTGWMEESRTELTYGFLGRQKPAGWGLVLKKS